MSTEARWGMTALGAATLRYLEAREHYGEGSRRARAAWLRMEAAHIDAEAAELAEDSRPAPTCWYCGETLPGPAFGNGYCSLVCQADAAEDAGRAAWELAGGSGLNIYPGDVAARDSL